MARKKASGIADWTVMIYMCADNDLTKAAEVDLEEMKQVGSTDRVNVLVQLDPRRKNKPTVRYRIRRGTQLASDIVGKPLGEKNTGDPAVLIAFARWAFREYKARHYLLILWNHGLGWYDSVVFDHAETLGLQVTHRGRRVMRAAAADAPDAALALGSLMGSRGPAADDGAPTVSIDTLRSVRARVGSAMFSRTITEAIRVSAIGLDDRSADFLDNQEMKKVVAALSTTLGRPIDIVGMDACWMSMAEVLTQLRKGVAYVVSSEDTTPAAGWPYDRILKALVANPGIGPRELADTIVRKYVASYPDDSVTLSACDLQHTERLSKSLNSLGRELCLMLDAEGGRAAISKARRSCWASPDEPEYRDLGDFCARLRRVVRESQGVHVACSDVLDVIGSSGLVVRSAFHGAYKQRPRGVAVWFPSDAPAPTPMAQYESLDMVGSKGWGRFIRAFTHYDE